MQWLNEFLGVEAPPGTELTSAELGFRAPLPWPLLVVIFLVLAGGCAALYRLERGKIGLTRGVVLATLRTLALFLVVLLLFRPLLRSEFESKRPRPIFVLLDNSQSMKQIDRRLSELDRGRVAIAQGIAPGEKAYKDVSRLEIVRAALENPKIDLLGRLRKQGVVRPYFFGGEIHGALREAETDQPNESLLAGFDGHETQTALADAVNSLLQRKEGDLPAAVVVVTDGRDNFSKLNLDEAARECARLGVPLHVYGAGSSEAGSLQIRDVAIADTIFFDDTVAVPLRYRALGFKKGTVQITMKLVDKNGETLPLKIDGKQTVKEVVKEFPLRPGEDLRELLTFTLTKGKERETKADLVAQVVLKDSPEFKDTLTKPVRVIDSKVKVLYLEYAPRWEYKFLQPALLRDRRIDAKFLLVSADKETLKPPSFLPKDKREQWPYLQAFPTREQLLGYDVVILGDMPGSPKPSLTAEQNQLVLNADRAKWLKEFVETFRGGLLVMAGRQHLPSSYPKDSPLSEILPVEFIATKFYSDSELRPEPFTPVLTEPGQRANMLALADLPAESVKIWQKLPGFYWHYPVTRLKPGAVSYLAHPRVKVGDQAMPILASHFYGKGQVLFMASDETWRWRYNEQDKIFNRFWGQLIYQVGLPHMLGNNSSRVQLALERSEAVVGRPGLLYARLLDKEFQPLKVPGKKVSADLLALDAKEGQERMRALTLEQVEGQPGEFRVMLPHDTPGRYEVKMNVPEPTTFAFRVTVPPRHELEEAPMAEETLRAAAQLSGGQFYQEEDLYRLPDNVRSSEEKFTIRQEVLLWNWVTFLLFVGLLTAEWVIRKLSNLS